MDPKTLYLHSSGPPVRALQLLLRTYQPGLQVDGKFGPKTEHAVRAAQRKLAIFPADGMAGAHTLDALAKAARAAKPATSLQRPPPPAPASFGSRLGAAAHEAEHAVVQTVDQAVQAVETWIAGLNTRPTPVSPVLHPAVQPAKAKAQREPAPPGDVADAKTMSLSELGRQFVFRHEAGNGKITAHLHHPPGDSGVTIGPGYDMKERTPEDIAADLRRINVDPAAAAAAAKGASLHGEAADQFVAQNKSLLNLSLEQQVLLQRVYKGRYENMVRKAVTIPLHQYEFDALVSFAGNPGTNEYWQTTTRLVNEHRPQDAMAEVAKVIHSRDPRVTQGLINRRAAEAKLFLYGDYAA